LVIFLTVVPQSCLHPFCKPGQAVAVPLLQRVTAECLTGAVTLICQNRDLVHQVRMLRPARRDDINARLQAQCPRPSKLAMRVRFSSPAQQHRS
jgi:hypothetical protein